MNRQVFINLTLSGSVVNNGTVDFVNKHGFFSSVSRRYVCGFNNKMPVNVCVYWESHTMKPMKWCFYFVCLFVWKRAKSEECCWFQVLGSQGFRHGLYFYSALLFYCRKPVWYLIKKKKRTGKSLCFGVWMLFFDESLINMKRNLFLNVLATTSVAIMWI